MHYLLLFVFLFCGCVSEDDGVEYGLHIGNSIDIFANYGDLSQVTQVISADYEEENPEPTQPFREKNLSVFNKATSEKSQGSQLDMNIMLCETFDDLLTSYFQNFKIEGTEKPWKAFMGDWITDEIMRTLGLENDWRSSDNCCYVLVKMTKIQNTVKLGDLRNSTVKYYIQNAIDDLDMTNATHLRHFMKSYGTHYIDSYSTGDFIYQVFKYKRSGFKLLKSYIKLKETRNLASDNIRFYFSSYFLKQVGEIRVASGNKTTEEWARRKLRDAMYQYSRPSLLRLHYSPVYAYQLNEMLDDTALLSLSLKTLRPLFKDEDMAEKFAEIVENDLKLWEVNA